MPTLHHPGAREVLALLDALPPGARVATDCDGTVWQGDIGDDVVVAAARFPERFASLPEPVDFDAYRARLDTDYEGACLYACDVLRGVDPAVAKACLRAVVPDDFAPRAWFVDALNDAMDRGVEVWLVSASPLLAVEVGAEIVGLQRAHKVGIELAEEGFVAPWPIGEGKPAAWRARGLPPADVALGDTRWDQPLLDSAVTGCMLVKAHLDPHKDTAASVLRG